MFRRRYRKREGLQGQGREEFMGRILGEAGRQREGNGNPRLGQKTDKQTAEGSK